MVDGARLVSRSEAISGTASALSSEGLAAYRAFAGELAVGPAQEPRWIEAWQDAAPVLLVEVRRGDDTLLMLPLELAKMGPFTVARFVGGRHANANYPAFKVGAATDEELKRAVVAALRRSGRGVDLLLLERMNDAREGIASPLMVFGTEPSPNIALAVALGAPFEALVEQPLFRKRFKKHRSQARKFEAAGGWRRVRAETPEEARRILETFFALKAERFRQAGIADVFAEPAVKEAFHRLFEGALEDANPRFSLEAIEVGGKIRAITSSSRGCDRITCEFGAIADDELSKQSPGEFLFFINIREAADSGMAFYDFGVGDEPYKRAWCDTEWTHWDAMAPLSIQGQVLAGMLRGSARLKGALKRNQVLWQAFKRLRKQTAGTHEAAGED